MRFHLLAAAAVLSIVSTVQAQNWPGRSVRRVDNGVEVLDSSAAAPRRIFVDTTQRQITDLSVAPGGAHVAFVGFTRLEPDAGTYADKEATDVVVLDAVSGRLQLIVAGGLSYVWCGSDCIAVLYGTYNEGSEGGPYGDSLDLFRASTGRRVRSYHPADISFIAPRWVASDSAIIAGAYRREGPAGHRIPGLRIDLRSGELRFEAVASGARSGSGRFLHSYEMDGDWVTRAGNDSSRIRPPIDGRFQAEEWLGRSDNMLLITLAPRVVLPRGSRGGGVRPIPPRPAGAPPAERTYRIWDVSTGQVSEEWKAAETPWRGPAPNSCRLFLKDGKLTAAPGCR